MVSGQPVLLIVAADRRELGGFPEAVPVDLGLRWSAECEIAGRWATLVAHGPGQANAREAVLRAFGTLNVDAVLSAGFVGGLDPDLRTGDIFVAEQVRQADDAVKYSVNLPLSDAEAHRPGGSLLTVDRVAQTVEDKSRLRRLGAAAVDMEAFAVVEEAWKREVACYCVRVVSDAANQELAIDFNRARRPDGTFSGWGIAAQVVNSPRRWKELLELKRTADQASQRLARFIRTCRFPPKPS